MKRKIPEIFKKINLKDKEEKKLARFKDTFPDDYLNVRKVNLVISPHGLDVSTEYKGKTQKYLDNYEKNLIFIVPNEDTGEEEDHGIGGSVKSSFLSPLEN